MVGTFGIGCFSFYPSKNLGCFGDGGAISTNEERLDRNFRVFIWLYKYWSGSINCYSHH